MSIMVRNGSLPEAPQALREAEFKLAYSNPVSIAQRSGELASISQLIQFLVPFAQLDPTVIERFETGRVAELAAEILKVSPKVFRTQAEQEQKKAAEQQQQQMMDQMQQAQVIAQQQAVISQSRRDESVATLNESKANAL
jgi:hypothetical protein|tara:strand:+ start:122 stop:541 length:420 start_codon:yes stop_codon:yes gene_type:complete